MKILQNKLAGILLLAGLVAAIYSQVYEFDFLNYDDGEYVYDNPNVSAGITAENLKWVWTAKVSSNWHPLTLLSHMLDVELFGLNAGAHHLVNVGFHALNAILLYMAFGFMTGAWGRSLLLALLFAAHPLHVESVAWVSERKDMLSGMIFLLILWAYGKYTSAGPPRNGRGFYLLMLFLFILGLMMKPMLVTLPFVLFLLDIWPLRRMRASVQDFMNLLREKTPFFALSILSCGITLIYQQKAMASLVKYPLWLRYSNALASYGDYLIKTFFPIHMGIPYCYRGDLFWGKIAASAAALILISALTIKLIRRQPYLFAGWFWFIGMLVPVIGLVQVGSQPMADRYTYLPHIGFFAACIWSAGNAVEKYGLSRKVIIFFCAALVIVTAVIAWRQTRFWRTSIDLFAHTVKIFPDNYVAHNNLGLAYFSEKRYEEAIKHYARSIAINPKSNKAYNNMGQVLSDQGKLEEAIAYYIKSIALNPQNGEAYYNLGVICVKQKRNKQAVHYYKEAIRINPEDSDAHNNLGNLLMREGYFEEAKEHFLTALEINPRYERAWFGLGDLFLKFGKTQEARVYFERALKLKPDYEKALNRLKEIKSIPA